MFYLYWKYLQRVSVFEMQRPNSYKRTAQNPLQYKTLIINKIKESDRFQMKILVFKVLFLSRYVKKKNFL